MASSATRARKADCDACVLRDRCRPGDAGRKVLRSIHEGARDLARDLLLTHTYLTSRRERKKVAMLFAHFKRILKLDRLRLKGPNGAKDEFHLAATAKNLRKMAKLIPMPAPAMAGWSGAPPLARNPEHLSVWPRTSFSTLGNGLATLGWRPIRSAPLLEEEDDHGLFCWFGRVIG